mgnify:CR=1 FL=1
MINSKIIQFDNNRYSIIFLIFLTFFVQKIIIIKLLGLFIIYFFYPFVLKNKNEFTLKFYIGILLFSILNGFLYLDRHGYYVAFFLSVVFWALCYLSTKQVYYFVKNSTLNDVASVIHLFFFINVIFWVISYLKAIKHYHHVFPFIVHNGAGDFMKSIYSNSSIAMIIFSFFAIYFVAHKKFLFSGIGFFMLLLTTYMSGIVIFLGSIIVFSFTSVNLSLLKRLLLFIVFPFCIVIFIKTFAPTNYEYVISYLDPINTPRKIISFYQTFNYLSESVQNFFIGAGPGNFSSRVGFTISGTYVSWFPHEFKYISKDFLTNHLSLWNPTILAKYNDGTANQPFSIFNQLLGEYGIVGMLLFLSYYFVSLFKISKNTIGIYLVVLFLAYGLLDYWFEYFSVIPIFELIFLCVSSRNFSPNISNITTKRRRKLRINYSQGHTCLTRTDIKH